MALDVSAPWHRASFDWFLQEGLPQLLAARIPLVGYHVEPASAHACRVRLTIGTARGDLEVEYPNVPQPDGDGVFEVDGVRRIVYPVASEENLDLAEIRCVGQQLYRQLEERLGGAPAVEGQAVWGDAALVKAWLPLDEWVRHFLRCSGCDFQATNWLDRVASLRRISIPSRTRVITPGQFWRTCPFETPEGPNIGKLVTLAVGATIRDDRIVVVDHRPEAALGVTASMVPFLEHSDPIRLLMGVNVMRQWLVPPDPEPALVQTGSEADALDFWCGRNLLTAFVALGEETYEDGIVISESCARRLSYPAPIEPGDKLSNRHGTKGVISRILPDEEMPQLPDGTPVELVFSFIGLHTRLNFGQIREAVMGRIARAEGAPAIVPPFHAPDEAELRARLSGVGLPEDGMETLTLGRGGPALQGRTAVGWVYWGRTVHLAAGKMHASVDGTRANRCGELEYYALREAGAVENIREQYNTRAAEREDAAALAARAAAGPVVQAGPPTPRLAEVARRLAAAGIRAELAGGRLSFLFARPEGSVLKLARPVRHPWLRELYLNEIGEVQEMPAYEAVVQANSRLERILAGGAPAVLEEKAYADLADRVLELFAQLLTPDHLRFGARVLFSARAVAAPGIGLRTDQVGLPEEIAWVLFGPLVGRDLGTEEAAAPTERAAQTLDALMARSWVLVSRAPALGATAFLAFHPVCDTGRVIRLHPLACPPLNADYDGDQVAVYLPLTDAGQSEAGERLTLAGQLARDPALLSMLAPRHEALWGLARLSLAPDGLAEVAALAGQPVAAPEGFVTRASLTEALSATLAREGAAPTLAAIERLMARGFAVARGSGASLSPFAGARIPRPPEPEGEDPEAWARYADELSERIAADTDYLAPDLGPQLLAVKSGARGALRYLNALLGARGTLPGINGAPVPIRHGLVSGMDPEEVFALVLSEREKLGEVELSLEEMGRERRAACQPRGFHVLARAMRARHPGVVFARATAAGEVDPLTDLDSRLFVGLGG